MTIRAKSLEGDRWNLFQHKHEPTVWCAVPAEHSLPRFLLLGAWTYSTRGRDPVLASPFFRERAASHSADLNGFYLFNDFEREGSRARPGAAQGAQP